MEEKVFFKTRIYFTGIITFAIWTLLAWSYYHGGVKSHHILANKDLPEISNWWGGILLPLLTWFLLRQIQNRISCHNEENSEKPNYQKNIFYRFICSLLFGALLSTFFTFDSPVTGYMVLSLFPLALFFPIFRAECLLGFVLSMTFTFGTVLPILVGSILTLVSFILYKFVGPIFLRLFKAIRKD
ncbi:hypothetical protein Q73A0000_02220 [Kaistella flava (ex Peng et al. 2021)]|uniref:Uncharacterized protein n=1 Tax=Kaistella flava (ex Peng et al. 2021) TaxID=2038776 RepID=A0A7M2Y584_9FLAO|nr:hypothetical protein [Kaistella flava (ex Peng et al. 2021)]QOW09256.1 hypothetical protein Q73A0000_02220 [Kaistella flava (ex Peng et al. 2021)]